MVRKDDFIMANNFEIKKNLVLEDKSRIFANWKKVVPTLTKEEFIANLEWVCKDPCENGDGTGRLTREIGLTPNGIIHISRINNIITTMYREDNGLLWCGEHFTLPIEKCIINSEQAKKMGYADKNGMVTVVQKISLSARDQI